LLLNPTKKPAFLAGYIKKLVTLYRKVILITFFSVNFARL